MYDVIVLSESKKVLLMSLSYLKEPKTSDVNEMVGTPTWVCLLLKF